MECVLARSAHTNVRRVLETLLEGSSVALVRFQPAGPVPVNLQALDATWTCGMTVDLGAAAWTSVTIPREIILRVELRKIMEFVRKGKGRQCLRWTVPVVPSGTGPYWPEPDAPDDHQLHLSWSPQLSVTLPDMEDDSPYRTSLPIDPWPQRTLALAELSNIILDMAVGGTECSIHLAANGTLRFSTEFETGYMEHDVPPTSPHDGHDLTCGPFIVKWLKLLCSLTLLSHEATLFLEPDQKQTVCVRVADEHVVFHLWLRRYLGPHGTIVPEGFRKFALRVQL